LFWTEIAKKGKSGLHLTDTNRPPITVLEFVLFITEILNRKLNNRRSV